MGVKVLVASAVALITALLILFLLDLSAVDRSYVEHAAKAADNYSETTHRQESQVCLRLPAVEAQKCIDDARKAAQDERREQYDLSAQRQTALWTKWMGIAALIGMSVSIVGVLLVWWTFRETRKTAAAATEANRISADTAQRQLRAYVVVTGFAATPFEEGKTPEFKIEITNGGQTHARGLHLISNPFWYRPNEGEPAIRFKREPGGPRSKMTLGPNKPYTFDDHLLAPLTRGQADALNKGEIGLIYAGVFVYRDIFGRRRITTFKTRYDHAAPGAQKFAICLRGNVTG